MHVSTSNHGVIAALMAMAHNTGHSMSPPLVRHEPKKPNHVSQAKRRKRARWP